MSLAVDQASAAADGVADISITVTAVDAAGLPVEGAPVIVAASGSGNVIVATTTKTDAAGQLVATLASTRAELKHVTASAAGVHATPIDVAFVAGPIGGVAFVTQPADRIAGEPFTLEVAIVDAFGNAITDATGEIDVSLHANLEGDVLAGPLVSSITAGVATFTGVHVDRPGSALEVTAELPGIATRSSDPFDVTPGTASALSTIAASPHLLDADGTTAAGIDVIARNEFGVPLGGAAIALAVDGSGNTLGAASGFSAGDGTFHTTLASSVAELKNIAATVDAVPLSTDMTFVPPACTPTLGALPVVATPHHVAAIVTGDFDGDGTADLVTGNRNEGGLSFAHGRGDGRFGAAIDTALSGDVSHLIAADFDGDTKLDLAIVATDRALLRIAHGRGDGTFATPIDTLLPAFPDGIAAADFNADGKTDVVVAIPSANEALVFLGHGDGTFAAPVALATVGAVHAVAVGDLDVNGKPDVVIAGDSLGAIAFIGKGNGTFNAGLASGFDGGNVIVVGDLDGDAVPDLAVLTTRSTLEARHGNKAGKFTGTVRTTDIPSGGCATLVDLDHDGKLDLVTCGQPASFDASLPGGEPQVAHGNGDLTFAPIAPVPVHATAVAVAELDGDGATDLAFGDPGAFGVLRGRASGQIAGPSILLAPASSIGLFAGAGDLDGDHRIDLAGTTGPLFTQADGTLAVGAAWPVVPQGGAIADLDGDLHPDVVVRGFTATLALRGDGAGGFTQTGSQPVAGTGLIVADVTRDHVADAIETGGGTSVTVLASDGAGGLAPASSLALGCFASSVAAGDLDGDGDPDVATVCDADTSTILLGDGAGSFGAPAPWAGTQTRDAVLLARDLNGDGVADLVAATGGQLEISLAHDDGTGTFDPPAVIAATAFPEEALVTLDAVDVDGDGTLDVVALGRYLYVLRGYGDGTFRPPLAYAIDATTTQLVLADQNGDGAIDAITVAPRTLAIVAARGGACLP